MARNIKDVANLGIADFQKYPVWEYVNDDSRGETMVRPVLKTPVKNLNGRLVGSEVVLANGSKAWCLMSNVNVASADSTRHFITISFMKGRKLFHLARYHDIDVKKRGPKVLAKFLKLKVNEIFPLKYDLRATSKGKKDALCGVVDKEPAKRLTREEIFQLAISG